MNQNYGDLHDVSIIFWFWLQAFIADLVSSCSKDYQVNVWFFKKMFCSTFSVKSCSNYRKHKFRWKLNGGKALDGFSRPGKFLHTLLRERCADTKAFHREKLSENVENFPKQTTQQVGLEVGLINIYETTLWHRCASRKAFNFIRKRRLDLRRENLLNISTHHSIAVVITAVIEVIDRCQWGIIFHGIRVHKCIVYQRIVQSHCDNDCFFCLIVFFSRF